MLDALAAENSVEAASVSAELLYGIAARIGGRRLTDDPGWRRFAEKGAALLEHDDPFVRGMAAWALDRRARRQPRHAIPARYARVDGEMPRAEAGDLVGVRFRASGNRLGGPPDDAGALRIGGRHRASRGGAGVVCPVERRGAAAATRGCRPGKAQEGIRSRGECAAPARISPPAGKWWMDVRRAARDVVLAGPDMDFREVVFFKVPVRTEGNHPDCLVQNHDRPKERRPGGDVFVQAGMGPADAVRPLIAGQLGPGHVQDMDLWWDADRLVFAYVRQPHWGNVPSSWGSVSWRNGPKVTVFDHVVGFEDGVFWENGSEPTHLYEIRSGRDRPASTDRRHALLRSRARLSAQRRRGLLLRPRVRRLAMRGGAAGLQRLRPAQSLPRVGRRQAASNG